MAGRKSRHYRDESDLLLGVYSSTLSTSSKDNANSNGNGNDHSQQHNDYYTTPNTPPPIKQSSFSKLQQCRTPIDNDDNNNNNNNNSPPKKRTKQKKKKKQGYRVHRVSYTAKNHVQVLFRRYASAFPQVSPFVAANVVWTLIIYYLKHGLDLIDLTFHSSVGHSFMGLLVSFLIVNRSQIAYNRFMEFRRHLAESYRSCRELAQHTTVYTFQTQTQDAAYWRQEVCYRTILLLRVTMDALLWSATRHNKWEDEYFKLDHDRDARNSDYDKERERSTISKHFYLIKQLSHGRRSYIDENFRSPINFSHLLKQVIMEHPYYLGYKMPVNEYRDLLQFVEKFITAFHGFRVLIFTPYPFPLLQMSRAFLFFWVYTLPMVLLNDYRLWSSILIVMLVSFGFIGVEYVSMSLDDPLADDTNDIDEHGMSLLVYEDIYLAIYRTDGPDAAVALRNRVLDRYRQGRELECYRSDLKGWDMWEMPEWWHEQRPSDDSNNVHCETHKST